MSPSNTTETWSWQDVGSANGSQLSSNSLVIANQPVILPPELAAPWDSYVPLIMTPTTYDQYLHNVTMWNKHIGIVSHEPISIPYANDNVPANNYQLPHDNEPAVPFEEQGPVNLIQHNFDLLTQVDDLQKENASLKIHIDSLTKAITTCSGETQAMQEERIRQKEKLLASEKIQEGLVEELKKLHDYCANVATWQQKVIGQYGPQEQY